MARDAIIALPQDLKTALRLVEDPDLEDICRKRVAGAILHVLSASNAIPGARGTLQHVGDILLLRIVLQRARESCDGWRDAYLADPSDLLASLDSELEVAKAFLGRGFEVLESAAEGVESLVHHGHSAAACVEDEESSNWLYDEVQEAIVERFEFDEDDVARELKEIDRIAGALLARATSAGA